MCTYLRTYRNWTCACRCHLSITNSRLLTAHELEKPFDPQKSTLSTLLLWKKRKSKITFRTFSTNSVYEKQYSRFNFSQLVKTKLFGPKQLKPFSEPYLKTARKIAARSRQIQFHLLHVNFLQFCDLQLPKLDRTSAVPVHTWPRTCWANFMQWQI